MDTPSSPLIRYPSSEQIVRINKVQIALKGGEYSPPFNLFYEGAIEPVLYAIKETIFGEEIYPTLYDKAAALTWKLITGHLFRDGNKRTGMAAGIFMLRINNKIVRATTDEIIEVALLIATVNEYQNGYTQTALKSWLEEHT